MMCPFVPLNARDLIRIFFAHRTATYGLLFSILSLLGCENSQDTEVGVAPRKDPTVVESSQEISFQDFQSELRDSGHLDDGEHIFFYNSYVDLPCVQIISAEAVPQIHQRGEDCPSIVVESASGFDMVIAYRDEYCPEPPALVVQTIGDTHLLRIDTTGNRGICESAEQYKAIGINLN